MPLVQQPASRTKSLGTTMYNTLLRHLSFLGPGLIAAVAYCDPGNWATDMEAGSRFGYKLLFTVLLSGLFAVLLQVLSCRLGAVTHQDLSVQTRRLVLGLRDDISSEVALNTRKMRLRYWLLLIPLYFVNEVAIIATELAELIGSAIALNLLFPSLPLWAGVLITTADVFLILILYRPSTGVRLFELLIGVLVIIVLVCFCILLGHVEPDWGDVFYGYVPSKTVFTSKGLYVSISILGATIMPHSLVLGSHFATIDRLAGDFNEMEETNPTNEEDDLSLSTKKKSIWQRLVASNIKVPEMVQSDAPAPKEPVSLRYMNLTLQHASWDIAVCLVVFAITINSAILIVASAAFYYGHNNTGDKEIVGDLFQAFHLLRETTGKAPAILFAIALLAAGQSSSITVTLAGQIISEGFIHWRLTPFMRRLLTRAIAVIPSMIVAVVAGRDGLDQMLVASQVALSMALPFVSFPLLVITCSPKRMLREILPEPAPAPTSSASSTYGSVPASEAISRDDDLGAASNVSTSSRWWARVRHATAPLWRLAWPERRRLDPATGKKMYTFHNAMPIALLSWAIFLLICIADVFVLVTTLRDPSNA